MPAVGDSSKETQIKLFSSMEIKFYFIAQNLQRNIETLARRLKALNGRTQPLNKMLRHRGVWTVEHSDSTVL